MARAGRKRKDGPRNRDGRIKRNKDTRLATAFDRGTDYAQAMQAFYGPDGCDAIGRAYRAGLLGEGNEAKALLDTARAISNAYWSAYCVGGIRSAIGDQVPGSGVTDHVKAKRREDWLTKSLFEIDHMGQPVRRAFDQLVVDINPDCGPRWLDELLVAERSRMHADPKKHIHADPAHWTSFRRALEALKVLTKTPKVGIGVSVEVLEVAND